MSAGPAVTQARVYLLAHPGDSKRKVAKVLSISEASVAVAIRELVREGLRPRGRAWSHSAREKTAASLVARPQPTERAVDNLPEARLEDALAAVLPHATDEQLAAVMVTLLEVVESAVHEAAQTVE